MRGLSFEPLCLLICSNSVALMAVVLVVDDEFGIVKLLKEALTDEGHRVLIATNGQQALERAAEEKPALLVAEFRCSSRTARPWLKPWPPMQSWLTFPKSEAAVAERFPGCRLRAKALQYFCHCRARCQGHRAVSWLFHRPSAACAGRPVGHTQANA
jgi:hypothetical protein